MKAPLLLTFLFAFFLTGLVYAEPVELVATAAFHGTSTLHDFDGAGVSAPGAAEWTPDGAGGVLTATAIRFEVATLSTDHEKRDRNMMKMFDPVKFPAVTGNLKAWPLGKDRGAERILELHIHGNTVKVPVTLLSFEAKEDGIHFRCRFDLSLKACGLKRPSVLGVIKVGDTVTVEVESVLRQPEKQ